MKVNGVVAAFASVVGLTLAGCATLERSEVTTREGWLTAAGFQVQPADTPEEQSRLASMPPHKLVSKLEDGQPVYSYADPDYCRCLYVGGPPEFAAYQRLYLAAEEAEPKNPLK